MAQQYSQPGSRRGGRNRSRHYRDSNSSRWRPFADDDSRRDWPSGDRGWPERDYQDDTSQWSSGRQSGGGYGGPASYEYRGNQDRDDERGWSDREFAGDRGWRDEYANRGQGNWSDEDDRFDDSWRWSRGGGPRSGGQGYEGQGGGSGGQGYGGGQRFGSQGGVYGQGSGGYGGQGHGGRGYASQGQGSYGGQSYGSRQQRGQQYGGQSMQGGSWGSQQQSDWGGESQWGQGQGGGSNQWSSQAGPGQWSSQGAPGEWSGGQGQGSWGGQGQGQSSRQRNNAPKGYQRSDERLKDDICERLMHSNIDSSDVSVQVQSGKVSLEGTVPDRRMKHAVEDLVDNCIGVKEIDNRLRVNRDSDSDSSSSSSRKSSSTSSTSSGSTSSGSQYAISSSGRQKDRDQG